MKIPRYKSHYCGWLAGLNLIHLARNTAPAIAAASLILKDSDALMLVLPAENLITDVAVFEVAVRHASVGQV